jgi:predicted secreted protein
MTRLRPILALTVTALVAGLLVATSPAHAATKPTVTVTELPAQIRLIPGESMRLTLPTNVTTGFQWTRTVTGPNPRAIAVSKGTYQAPENSTLVGAPGTTTWNVRAVRPGRAVVEILATPPGGGQATKQRLTVIVMRP